MTSGSRTLQVAAQNKSNNLALIRLLFAVGVIFSHSFFFVHTNWPEPLRAVTGGQAHFGYLALHGLRVISGFLITASWLRTGNGGDFLLKRTLRIYPPFIIACLVCLFLVGPIGVENTAEYFRSLNWGAVLTNIALLSKISSPSVFEHLPVSNQLNGSLWSIKIEFECYLATALLGTLGVFNRRRTVLILTLIGCAFCVGFESGAFATLYPPLKQLSHYFAHIRFGAFFLIGSTYFLYRDVIPLRTSLFLGSIAALVVAAMAERLYVALPLAGPYALLFIAFNRRIPVPEMIARQDLSYGLYLYGWPAKLLVVHCFGATLNPYALFALALVIALTFAAGSWHWVEAPCLALMRRRKTPATPAMP